jgi:hypothetical protein
MEIHSILAEALDYPYNHEYGWLTGDHTEVTLAMEARGALGEDYDYDCASDCDCKS